MVLRFLVNNLIAVVVLCIALAFAPIFLDIEPVLYTVSFPKSFDGGLTINNRLSSAVKLFEEQLVRPESLAVLNNVIYTGVADGRIVKIENNKISTVARIGKKCGGPWEEHICGRVLGIKFDKKNKLYVVDAYYGLHVVDVKTGKVTELLGTSTLIEGKPLLFSNDLAFDEEENIYITDSSGRWPLSRVLYSIFEHDGTGRVIKFNPRTKEATVLVDGLFFPNGIELSYDKKSLLIAESNKNRILKYNLDSKAKKKLEVFVDALPGEPDNIRYSARKGYWISFVTARNTSSLAMQDHISQYPLLRKIVARFVHSTGSVLRYISQFFSSESFKIFAYEVETGRILVQAIPIHGLITELDENGKIMKSLHSPDGKIGFISEVLEHDGYLYLGSWHNKFLGRVKLV